MKALQILPAGRYFVGDPCYVIADEKWMDFLEGGTFAGNEMVEFEGGFAGCVSTEFGDGVYHAEGGYPPGPFPVDAGLLGAVSENLIAPKYTAEEIAELGVMVDFKRPFTVSREGAVCVIGHIESTPANPEAKMTKTTSTAEPRKIKTFGFDPSKLSDHTMADLMELIRRVSEAHGNPIGVDGRATENGRPTIHLIDKKGRHKLDQIGWAVYHKQREAKLAA